MNTEDRMAKAGELHAAGYNCAQCVLLATGDKLKVPANILAKLSCGLGGGTGIGEICGVANALAIGCGIIADDSTSSGKLLAMPAVRKAITEFSLPYGGKVTCRDLKGKCGATCDELIARGVAILSQISF